MFFTLIGTKNAKMPATPPIWGNKTTLPDMRLLIVYERVRSLKAINYGVQPIWEYKTILTKTYLLSVF